MEGVIVEYERHVPQSLIEDFNKTSKLNAQLHSAKDVEHFNDTGQIAADVTLILSNPYVQNVIGSALFAGIVFLFKGLRKLYKNAEEQPSIDIQIKTRKFQATLTIEGNMSDSQLDKCVDALKEVIREDNLQRISENPDFDNQEQDVPEIFFDYIIEDDQWKPYNFEDEDDDFWDEAEDRAKRKLD
ncbi:MAG: hypothetical protein JST90_17375 [Bacteroidetes bacterium]|nr:hypothetical protein [Bacteroidota bacterium]